MAQSDDDKLILLSEAVAQVVPHKVNAATIWRWTRVGVAGANGQRIVLPVTYIGRRVYTTLSQFRQWIQDTTAARR